MRRPLIKGKGISTWFSESGYDRFELRLAACSAMGHEQCESRTRALRCRCASLPPRTSNPPGPAHSNIGFKMLSKMGFEQGKGIGKSGNKFLKVLYTVALYRKYTRALTFESLCQEMALWHPSASTCAQAHAQASARKRKSTGSQRSSFSGRQPRPTSSAAAFWQGSAIALRPSRLPPFFCILFI